MQKKLLVAAVLSAFAGAASAQSANVTLYGTAFAHIETGSNTGGDTSTAAALGAGGVSSVRAVAANALNAGTGASLGQNYTATPADLSSRWRTTGSGANFGLRGTEDLGNGLSAWFQFEMSTAAALGSQGNASTSLGGFQAVTMRNSAVGLRSNSWGTVFTGAWDTPINVHYLQGNLLPQVGVVNTYASQAGFFGANPLLGGGAYSATSIITACNAAAQAALGGSAASCLNAVTQVDRRQTNTIQWWSPNWNGFEARFHVSPTTEQYPSSANNQAVIAGTGANAPSTIKPNIWGGSVAYSNGPLWVGAAYERKNDLLAAGVRTIGGVTIGNAGFGTNLTMKADMSSSKDDAWRLGARYKFDLGGGSKLGIGARYESIKWTMGYANAPVAGTSDLSGMSSKKWNLSASFETGRHGFIAEYFKANEISISTVSAAGATPTGSGGTGAKRWTLGYNYDLSKRTAFQVTYAQTTNEVNARYVGGVFFNLGGPSGADPKYFTFGMRHSF